MNPRKLLLVLALVIGACASHAHAQVVLGYPDYHSQNWQATGAVPTSSTQIITQPKVQLVAIRIVNSTASAITLTVVDGSTDCGGAACPIEPAGTTIPAGGIFTDNLLGMQFRGGIYWSASAAGLTGGIHWTN